MDKGVIINVIGLMLVALSMHRDRYSKYFLIVGIVVLVVGAIAVIIKTTLPG